jgi:predicted nucleic acid-binding protein
MAGTPAWISRQILREYLVQITRPGVLIGPSAAMTAIAQANILARMYNVADENRQVTAHLLQLLQTFSIGGKQIHDANIVATMQAYGIVRLLTNNPGDFARFAPLVTVEALPS